MPKLFFKERRNKRPEKGIEEGRDGGKEEGKNMSNWKNGF